MPLGDRRENKNFVVVLPEQEFTVHLICSHIMLNVSDLGVSREFYVDKLGFPVIEEHSGMFAFRAGEVRFTVTGSGTAAIEESPNPPATIMFRSADIEADVAELKRRGVAFEGDIQTAPGFMRFAEMLDPDNNYLYLAEYLRDPLVAEA